MKRLYIAGPMTGLQDLNFPAFNAETRRLRDLGHEVVNPAELCPDPAMSWHDCMRKDIAALVSCDGIVLLLEELPPADLTPYLEKAVRLCPARAIALQDAADDNAAK